MTVPENTKYPQNLTNAYWQTKKSFKDKTKKATKTGLGDKLTAAEKAWKAIPFDKLDATKHDPKSAAEAQKLLADAKTVRTTQVKAAIAALNTAKLKATETAKNADLSPAAKLAANAMVEPLRKLQFETLGGITAKDFEVLVAKAEAKEQGGEALTHVNIHGPHGGTVFGSAPKAVRKGDVVTVANVVWTNDAGDPKKLLNKTLTVKATHPDNSLYQNDMLLNKLSSDSKTVTLKSP